MSDSPVTIATFSSSLEAELMRGFLETHGVDVFLADENMSRIAPHLIPLVGGIKLQVRPEHTQRARELLSQPAPGVQQDQ